MSALDEQEGGAHYKGCAIQPVQYIHANGLGYCEGAVIKYVTRYKSKNGAEDLRKAIHFLQLLLELEYPENTEPPKPLHSTQFIPHETDGPVLNKSICGGIIKGKGWSADGFPKAE